MRTTYNFDVSVSSAVNASDETGEADRQETVVVRPLTPATLGKMERYWQAANYLTVAQIYLLDNPLLRQPLQREHIKPRLLGHWGTSPGLSLIYVHLNRLINERDANVIYLTGPGHGGPALVALAYLEGTYSEIYPEVAPDVSGLRHALPAVLDSGRDTRAMSAFRRRDRSTKAASSAMCSRMPLGQRSTTRT